MNIFEQATRKKLRFETAVGLIAVEDLWDLPLSVSITSSQKRKTSLDEVAKELNKAIRESGEQSFVKEVSTVATTLQLQFDIVKHIIDVKLLERKAAAELREHKERQQKLMAIIEEKQDQELKGKSLEELTAELAKYEQLL